MFIGSRKSSTMTAPACAAISQAVVQAILLDYEARSPDLIPQPAYGKQREPLVRVTALARAFPAPPTVSGTYSQTTNQIITITTTSPHLLNNGDTGHA